MLSQETRIVKGGLTLFGLEIPFLLLFIHLLLLLLLLLLLSFFSTNVLTAKLAKDSSGTSHDRSIIIIM